MRRGMQFGIAVAVFFVVIMCGGGGSSSGCGSETPTSTPLGNATLNGIVTSSVPPNGPIAGATVQVFPTGTTSILTATSANGSFSLPGLPAGSVRVEARAPGFRDFSVQLTLNPGTNTVNIGLIPNP